MKKAILINKQSETYDTVANVPSWETNVSEMTPGVKRESETKAQVKVS